MSENGFHILLVEDDASVRNSIAAALRDEGYAVQTASDGREAMGPPDARGPEPGDDRRVDLRPRPGRAEPGAMRAEVLPA